MDRSEAYNLLSEEMNKLALLPPDQLTGLCDNTVEIDRNGPTGTLYRVEMDIEQTGDTQFAVIGWIHDNSAYRFSLLEERLEFDVGTNE